MSQQPTGQTATVNDYYDKYIKDPEQENAIIEDATIELSSDDIKTLQARIQKKKDKVAAKIAKSTASTSKDPEVATPTTSVVEEKPKEIEVSDKEMENFWDQIEKMDPVSLISEEVLDAFKYIGYNPEVVLRTFLLRGKAKGRDSKEILKDLMDICTIAIIKGSITEKNLQKTSDEGKAAYRILQDRYDLKNGGAKGKGSEFLTVPRIAAATPAVTVRVIVAKPDLAKKFVGPFGSSALPSYLRHQAAAACIPTSIPDRLRTFLVGLITAYTADQSKALSKSKSGAEELFDAQVAFVETTYNSEHPKLEQRKAIFSQFSLSSDYQKLKVVADKIKKVKNDFEVLTQAQVDEDLAQ